MTKQDAQMIADMANKAEANILNSEMRDWYLSLPREQRVEIAMTAARATARRLAAA